VHGRLRRLVGQQGKLAGAQPLAHVTNPLSTEPLTTWDSDRAPTRACARTT
jgi:hypothetical protein